MSNIAHDAHRIKTQQKPNWLNIKTRVRMLRSLIWKAQKSRKSVKINMHPLKTKACIFYLWLSVIERSPCIGFKIDFTAKQFFFFLLMEQLSSFSHGTKVCTNIKQIFSIDSVYPKPNSPNMECTFLFPLYPVALFQKRKYKQYFFSVCHLFTQPKTNFVSG